MVYILLGCVFVDMHMYIPVKGGGGPCLQSYGHESRHYYDIRSSEIDQSDCSIQIARDSYLAIPVQLC